MHAWHRSISVLPTAIMGLLGLAAVAALYSADAMDRETRLALVLVAAGAVVTLLGALAAQGSSMPTFTRTPWAWAALRLSARS